MVRRRSCAVLWDSDPRPKGLGLQKCWAGGPGEVNYVPRSSTYVDASLRLEPIKVPHGELEFAAFQLENEDLSSRFGVEMTKVRMSCLLSKSVLRTPGWTGRLLRIPSAKRTHRSSTR